MKISVKTVSGKIHSVSVSSSSKFVDILNNLGFYGPNRILISNKKNISQHVKKINSKPTEINVVILELSPDCNLSIGNFNSNKYLPFQIDENCVIYILLLLRGYNYDSKINRNEDEGKKFSFAWWRKRIREIEKEKSHFKKYPGRKFYDCIVFINNEK